MLLPFRTFYSPESWKISKRTDSLDGRLDAIIRKYHVEEQEFISCLALKVRTYLRDKSKMDCLILRLAGVIIIDQWKEDGDHQSK